MNRNIVILPQARADWSRVLIYLAVAFVALVAVVAVVALNGGLTGPSAGLLYLAMFTPALAAIVACLPGREKFSATGLRLGERKWYLYAWAISLLLVLGVYGLAWLGGYARLDLRLERLLALGPGSNIANFQVPVGFSEQQFILLMALVNLTVANVPGIVLGLGEEMGWRGFLLPQLLPYGRRLALVAVGLIWWAWHLPLSFLQPEPPDIAASLVTGVAGAILYGAILAWLRYASGSIFPVALAHIAYNNANSAAILLLDAQLAAVPWFTLLVLAFACYLLWRRDAWKVLPHENGR